MSFFARISDVSIGGTYMTLLNTVGNLGSMWPITAAMALVDPLTVRSCVVPPLSEASAGSPAPAVLAAHGCGSAASAAACALDGGHCTVSADGYDVLSVAAFVCGLAWLAWARPRIKALQDLGPQVRPLLAWAWAWAWGVCTVRCDGEGGGRGLATICARAACLPSCARTLNTTLFVLHCFVAAGVACTSCLQLPQQGAVEA